MCYVVFHNGLLLKVTIIIVTVNLNNFHGLLLCIKRIHGETYFPYNFVLKHEIASVFKLCKQEHSMLRKELKRFPLM